MIKTKKFFAFLAAVCIIVFPLRQTASAAYNREPAMQSVYATDCENKGANTSVIPAWGEADLTSNVAPYSVTAGTSVRSITIYPVAKNIDTGDYFIVPSISKGIIFAASGQSEGIYLSKTQTAGLINQMKDYINSLDGNYEMYGWRIRGTVTFEYDRLLYITYRGEISFQEFQEHRQELSGSNFSKTFDMTLPYPKYVDINNDYYYTNINGTCYYQTSSGKQLGSLFAICAGFNRQA